MQFWQLPYDDRIALVEGTRQISYRELSVLADALAEHLPAGRGMGILAMPSALEAVALYLGALRSQRHVPLLMQPDTDPALLAALVAQYRPEWLALPGPAPVGYTTIHDAGRLRRIVRRTRSVRVHAVSRMDGRRIRGAPGDRGR